MISDKIVIQNHNPDFLYLSDFCSLSASGHFKHLDVCVSDGLRLEHDIMSAFQEAKRSGKKSPILVGAIPFDTSLPSSLYIPETYQFFDKKSYLSKMTSFKDTQTSIIKSDGQAHENNYKKMVEKAIVFLKQGLLNKVVLSRILNIELSDTINPFNVLTNLLVQNPSAYHFLMSFHDGSTLVGASPELLLKKQSGQISLNPLAGSTLRLKDKFADEYQSKQLLESIKDTYEHQLVVDDIKQRLLPLCSTLDVPSKPSLMSTPTMWHLSTHITGTLLNHKMNACLLASQIHPTPALCGFPRIKAKEIIQELENYNRGVFGGIIGWSDEYGNGEWAVIIRCGLLKENNVRLFSGAGIVEYSNPEKEWNETSAKLATMMQSLGIR